MRVSPLRATTTHGTTFHRPGRMGVSSPATAAVMTAWPETKLSPPADTSPRRCTSPMLVSGRARSTTSFTTFSSSSLRKAATTTATATSQRRNSSASTTPIARATMRLPNCWNGQRRG
jgi:hypothetical protein